MYSDGGPHSSQEGAILGMCCPLTSILSIGFYCVGHNREPAQIAELLRCCLGVQTWKQRIRRGLICGLTTVIDVCSIEICAIQIYTAPSAATLPSPGYARHRRTDGR